MVHTYVVRASIDSFVQENTTTNALEDNLTPDAVFELVQPMWKKQGSALQEQEIEFSEKDDYEFASAVAGEILKLDKTTPKNLQKMLQDTGPNAVILQACAELSANVVRGHPQLTMGLERAYKRMRISELI